MRPFPSWPDQGPTATHRGIDLGASNTTVCEDRAGSPHVVNLPELANLEPRTQTPVVLSCVCVLDPDDRTVLFGQSGATAREGPDGEGAEGLPRPAEGGEP